MPGNNKNDKGGGFLQDVFIFRELLLNHVFVVFDREQRRLGFAPAVAQVLSPSSSSLPPPSSPSSPSSSSSSVMPQLGVGGRGVLGNSSRSSDGGKWSKDYTISRLKWKRQISNQIRGTP
jgi:hypothetical protein